MDHQATKDDTSNDQTSLVYFLGKKNEKYESIITAKRIKNKSKVVTINPQHTKRRREIISLPIMLRGHKDAEGVLTVLVK